MRKAVDYFCHLAVKPEFYENLKKDTEFQQSIFADKIKWLAKDYDDIYDPGYSDMLRVSFMHQFRRGKLADLVSLLSGRDFETKEFREDIVSDAPCDYFSKAFMQCETKAIELGNICNLSQLNENLQENCIPLSVKNMDASSYEEFLTERRKLMASMMKRYYWGL